MLHGSYPNPFNPTTTILFSLAKRSKVSIAVYDIAGRLVKRLLVDEIEEAGDHRVVWDGTNEAGSRVASGVYFCMMRVEGEMSGAKLILLR
jgi:flagellar hook assembly protein FlgD